MKINDCYPGWIADNICNLCAWETEAPCEKCEVRKAIEKPENSEEERNINTQE